MSPRKRHVSTMLVERFPASVSERDAPIESKGEKKNGDTVATNSPQLPFKSTGLPLQVASTVFQEGPALAAVTTVDHIPCMV